jgi:type IV pilus assembly protein PilA
MLNRIRGERGFTLVELLVVLAILAILIAIVVPNLAGLTGGARGDAARTELSVVQTAMDTLMSENEAVTVNGLAQGNAAEVGPNTNVTYWFVTAINPDTGEEVYDNTTANLRLRTTSNGTYYWSTAGAVTQDSYAVGD